VSIRTSTSGTLNCSSKCAAACATSVVNVASASRAINGGQSAFQANGSAPECPRHEAMALRRDARPLAPSAAK
jgi:3-oxoacyl-(acyl-carrier-protein) synthase